MGPASERDALERVLAVFADLDAVWSAEPAAPRLSRRFPGEEGAYSKLVARIERATGTPLPALIEGPPGGVQSLVALTIHQTAPSRVGPFRRVRGAFAPRGWEEVARSAVGGTLYVSEVGALSEEGQRGLLACLREAQAAGSPRVIASADRDLGAAVASGWFLEELKDRLYVLRIPTGSGGTPRLATGGAEGSLEQLERTVIEARLAAFDWQQQRTADSLGIDRKTLYRKIQRYGLER